MKVRVVIFGQGLVATHFVVGLERLKNGEVEPYGVPLAGYKLVYPIESIDVVGSYDVDESKIGLSLYDIAVKYLGDLISIPNTLKEVEVRRGIHINSLKGLPIKAKGIEEVTGNLLDAINMLVDDFSTLRPDVFINVISTEHAESFNNWDVFISALRSHDISKLSASQVYAYAVFEYARIYGRSVVLINAIPTPLANDDAFVEMFRRVRSLILGDDGATGATPLTADILEHLKERGRRVKSIAQFNIGGNTDFLTLTIPERNIMKEKTKSSIVEDVLGYDVPHYIKPTGYLEPLGDKKFVSMHIAWKTFNEFEDELIINLRINDSPALAGLLIDLARVGKALVERGVYGTCYRVNSFFMKAPGPRGSRSISRIIAYYNMIKYLRDLRIINQEISIPGE